MVLNGYIKNQNSIFMPEWKPNRRGGNVLSPQWKIGYDQEQPEKLYRSNRHGGKQGIKKFLKK